MLVLTRHAYQYKQNDLHKVQFNYFLLLHVVNTPVVNLFGLTINS